MKLGHARAIIACDFCVTVTSTFRVLYVLVVIEHHSRKLVHVNVAAHPMAQWTRQQLREAVGYEERHAYLLGLRVLKSPPRSPTANLICECVIGTIRRGLSVEASDPVAFCSARIFGHYALEEQVRQLERLLGKKTAECETLREVLERG